MESYTYPSAARYFGHAFGMMYVTLVHSLSLLYGFPLYESNVTPLQSTLSGYIDVVSNFNITNSAAVKFVSTCIPGVPVQDFLEDTCLERELLD